jgi:hypothetical protein
MKSNILKLHPFDKIEECNSIQCLLLESPSKAEIKDIFGSNKNVAEALIFIKQLKRGRLLEISFDHGCMSDTSYFDWVYHPQHNCGIIVWVNDSFPDEPRYEDIESCTSQHLAEKLGDLFDINGFKPGNIEGDQVTAPLEGVKVKDLVAALAASVFVGLGDKRESAALDWVKTYVHPKSRLPKKPRPHK